MKLTSLFDQAVDLSTGQRHAFLAELEARDRTIAEALKRLLDAEKNAVLLEPNVAALRSVAAELSANSPRTIGGFQLLRPIGRGGMGEVWLAVRNAGAAVQQVALKILRFDIGNEDSRLRFQLEQKIIASMNHPYVARMIDANHGVGELPWIAMEYVDGNSLSEWCKERQLSVRARIELALKILEAVGHAHQHLIVHRDLKFSNVMVTKEGVPKLLDFGIAKRMGDTQKTATAQRFFSVGSVAPEQYTGEKTTVATDIYQMGLMLYELLAGVPAYDLEGMAPAQIQESILHRAPELPSRVCTAEHAKNCGLDRLSQLQRILSGELDRIVMYALRKNPAERYSSSLEFARDLQAYLEGRPVLAAGQSIWYQSKKFLRRHWLPSSLAGFALLALLALMLQLVLRDAALTLAREEALVARDSATKERDKAQNLNTFLIDLFRSASPTAINKKDVSSIVLDAIELQISRQEFVADPSAAFALTRAALGLGELAQAKRFIEILGRHRALYSADEKRQLLLIQANLANIEGDLTQLRQINAQLAREIGKASFQQQIMFIGYVGQTLISANPERVLRFTDINPLPAPLIRLRARAFSGLGQHQAAAEMLIAARTRSDLTTIERLSLLQSLTLSYLAINESALALKVSEEMVEVAGANLGEQNPRLVPFWNTRAEALAQNGQTSKAIEIYEELLAWKNVSKNLLAAIRLNRLMLGSNSPRIDSKTRSLARAVWKDRSELNEFSRAFAELALLRVLVFERRLNEAKQIARDVDANAQLDDTTRIELSVWRAVLLDQPTLRSLSEWQTKLRSVNSRDIHLTEIIAQLRVTNSQADSVESGKFNFVKE